jgi:GNAT superfamily N-acetyltransferase
VGTKVQAFNTAFVMRPLDDPALEVRRAMRFYEDRGLPYSVRIREGVDPNIEAACEELGLIREESSPGMVLPEIPVVIPVSPPELEVRRVTFEEGYDDYVVTMSVGSSMPVELGYDLISPELSDTLFLELYTGYVGGQAVTTSAVVVSHRVAGVYNVATLEGHRRKGYGAAMTWHAIARGQKKGAEIASLQSTEMGTPVYEKMGFIKVASYVDFAPPEE